MSDGFKYRCDGCGVVFETDLEPLEIRFCPICASAALRSVETAQPVQCASCGESIWPHDSRECLSCGRPLCRECWGKHDFCVCCLDRESLRDAAPLTVQ